MAYAHALCDKSDNIIIVTIDEAVTVTEMKFLMSVDTFSEVLGIAEEFEDSIKKALDSNENQDEGHSDTDEEVDCPANVEQDILTYHY